MDAMPRGLVLDTDLVTDAPARVAANFLPEAAERSSALKTSAIPLWQKLLGAESVAITHPMATSGDCAIQLPDSASFLRNIGSIWRMFFKVFQNPSRARRYFPSGPPDNFSTNTH